jgi:hypothetical protein
LNISVQAAERLSLEQIRAFLEASSELRFEADNKQELYDWVQRILVEQQYAGLSRAGKGLIRRYVAKMTGLSRAQVTRLIGQQRKRGRLQARSYERRRFPTRYTDVDTALLAAVDEAHQTLSGPATQQLLQRAFHDFGDERFQQLAQISVAQLYRMRKSRAYRQRRTVFDKTRPAQISIGERRRPEPRGRPGYVRVDTVHQGDDPDGRKGVYHINAVDEVTQWQVVGAVPQISEAWLLPMLQAMLEQFPFRLHGFHSDNGSEFINHRVEGMLNKLLIEQTKSRPQHSNDNGLVEAKNGAVIRKHMGYRHIAAENAAAVEQFYRQYFNPYLNFHRPCAVPELVISPKGKRKRVYRWYATPWQILRQLPELARFLRPDLTVTQLDARARAQSDTEAAWQMQDAKRQLFASFQMRRTA